MIQISVAALDNADRRARKSFVTPQAVSGSCPKFLEEWFYFAELTHDVASNLHFMFCSDFHAGTPLAGMGSGHVHWSGLRFRCFEGESFRHVLVLHLGRLRTGFYASYFSMRSTPEERVRTERLRLWV